MAAIFCVAGLFAFANTVGFAAAAERKALPPGAYYFSATSAFAVEKIRDGIFAISEPDYYQRNVSYVIVGDKSALVVDAGASTTEDMTRVVRSLTDKPFAVIPSHLHFDHIGGLPKFETIWLIDVPSVRALLRADGTTYIPPERHFGAADEITTAPFKASRMIAPGETIDLGHRVLRFLFTPGHSLDEIVIYDAADKLLFSGDFLYPGRLFCANAKDYLASAEMVLNTVAADTAIYGAHSGQPEGGVLLLPKLSTGDLADAAKTLRTIVAGAAGEITANQTGMLASFKTFPINGRLRILTDLVFSTGQGMNYPDGAAGK